MKFILLFLIIFFTGCASLREPIPVAPIWPDIPAALREECENLKTIDTDKVLITDMMKIVIENYTLYHQCSIKVKGWNEWYVTQKKIYETINKK